MYYTGNPLYDFDCYDLDHPTRDEDDLEEFNDDYFED